MKRLKISPLLTCAMSLQMIMSPVAFAINPLEAINMAGQIMMANQQNIAAQQNAMANQQMIAEMTRPGRDKYFNTDSLARVPGLMEYMARNGINPATLTCPTLPTTVTEVRAEVCRIGLTTDRGVAPQAQLGEMFSLYKTYGDVAKQYEAYSSISNAEGQGFGVGCMRNALQTLSGFFAYRTNELDKLTTNLEALQNQFREASKADLLPMEEATAVLNGGNSELANEVRSRRPDLFEFGKRFDNPACKSMFAGDTYNTMGNGSPGGLNQINKRLKDQYSAKSGKYSGESYINAHATVVEDITKMADKAAQQFQLNFSSITAKGDGFGDFLGDLQNKVSSTTGLNSQLRPDQFADAQMSFDKQNNAILSDLATLKNELTAAGADPSRALSIVNNLNAKNFDSEVTMVQNQIRNGCLNRAFTGSGFWDRIKKNIVDPTGSKFANKNDFNVLRERIQDIMTNPMTTPESKVSQLRALEATQGNRYILNMQGSYQKTTIDPKTGAMQVTNVSPSSSSPSTYFSDVVQTCDAQFSSNKLGSTMTGSSAIQKLRDINQQYRTLATNQANNIRNEIKKKLIECGGNAVEANNSQAGSCTPDRFNTSSQGGFCANAAISCANNMKSCTEQAQKFVNQIKAERQLRINHYSDLVKKNKADVVRIFDTALAKYMKEGEIMRGLFGAGFSSPSGIQREIQGDGKYIDKFRDATSNSPDGQLMLEDPEKYVDMFKKNINLLKAEVLKQQQEIIGGQGGRGGLLAQHVDQTERNYKTAKAKADEIANSCIQKHDQAVAQMEAQRQQQLAEQQKKMNELGERRQDFCNRYSMLDTNPNGACNGKVADLMVVPRMAGDPVSGDKYNRICGQVNSSKENNTQYNANRLCEHAELTDSRVLTDENLRKRLKDTLCPAWRKAAAECTVSTTQPTSDGQTVTRTCQGVTTAEGQVTAAFEVWRDQSGPAMEVSAAESMPAFCDAGYNGDRTDSLMGGRNMGQIIQQTLAGGTGTVGQ